jgi:hypothetical protein
MGELRDEVQRMLGDRVADDPSLLEDQVYATPWEVIPGTPWEVIPGTAWEVIRTPAADPMSLFVQVVPELQRVMLRLAEEIEKLQAAAR